MEYDVLLSMYLSLFGGIGGTSSAYYNTGLCDAVSVFMTNLHFYLQIIAPVLLIFIIIKFVINSFVRF